LISYPRQGEFDAWSGIRQCQDVIMASEPRRGYRALRKGRSSQINGVYLLTTVTDQRIPWFQVFEFGRITSLGLHCGVGLGDAAALCWVVMPDHVHVLLQLRELPLHRVMNRFKSTMARRLNRAIGRTGRFWQDGYHDRALRRDDDLRTVARIVNRSVVFCGRPLGGDLEGAVARKRPPTDNKLSPASGLPQTTSCRPQAASYKQQKNVARGRPPAAMAV
jgi:hypothetical protein